jgi:Fic family protein
MFVPKINISNNILVNIGKIEAVEEVIKHAPILPLWEKEFREDAIVRSVYHGTHLEGNMLEKDEAKNVLLGKDVMARSRDVQEVINYRNVIEYIDEQTKKIVDEISESTILKMHSLVVDKILPPEATGKYRTKQVVIKNSQTGEVTFTPPMPIEVPYLMTEFISWINNTSKESLHPVLKAGVAHHGGYDIRRFFSLEEYYDKDAVSYYESLQKATSGDMTAWLEYFTYGASHEFERIKNKILRLSKDAKLKEKFGGQQIFLTERQVKIIEYIQDIGYMQNKGFSSIFPEISDDSVLRDLKDLINKGLIKKIGKTKAARYVLTG